MDLLEWKWYLFPKVRNKHSFGDSGCILEKLTVFLCLKRIAITLGDKKIFFFFFIFWLPQRAGLKNLGWVTVVFRVGWACGSMYLLLQIQVKSYQYQHKANCIKMKLCCFFPGQYQRILCKINVYDP